MAATKVRVRGLTPMNVSALRETFRQGLSSGELTLGKTYADFHMDADEAMRLLTSTIAHTPGSGHPKASLYAVRRKLVALANGEAPAEQEQQPTAKQVVAEELVQEPSRTIDQAALFLVDLMYPNMFELHGTAAGVGTFYVCKVCREQVPRSKQEEHHAGHKSDRSTYASEQIQARREKAMAAKADKRNVSDLIEQYSIPKVYLREDGKKFKPGGDAQLKRDLIHAIAGWVNPDALHTFEGQAAAKILSGFGWNPFYEKALKNREAKEARESAKAATKAQTERDKAAAKKTAKAEAEKPADTASNEVTPDPKPTRAPARRGGRIGS